MRVCPGLTVWLPINETTKFKNEVTKKDSMPDEDVNDIYWTEDGMILEKVNLTFTNPDFKTNKWGISITWRE